MQRSLGWWEAAGTTLSVMSPTLGMAFAVPLVAASAGRASPLVFLLAGFGALVIAFSFAAFSRRIADAGSVYAFVGSVLGRRAGFLTAWLLLLAYGLASALAVVVSGIFASAALGRLIGAPAYIEALLDLFVLLLVYWSGEKRLVLVGRVLLAVEILGLAGLLAITIQVLRHVPLDAAPFLPDPGRGVGDLARGSAIALMYYSGFESATTLGEETRRPLKTVPIVMVLAILLAAATYVLSSYGQVLGYGVGDMARFAGEAAPLDTLVTRYASGTLAGLFGVLVSVSGIACASGSAVAASRLLYALERDGALRSLGPAGTIPTPTRAASLIVLADLVLTGFAILATGTGVFVSVVVLCNALGIILVYLAVCSAFAIQARTRKGVPLLLAATATVLLLGLLSSNVYPAPRWPGSAALLLLVAWLAAGFAMAVRLGR